MTTEAIVHRGLEELRQALLTGLLAVPREERRTVLGVAYKTMVGYDPFEDDPESTPHAVLEMLLGNTEARILESEE